MSSESSFGRWLKHRRKALGLAQGELARQVGCATITLQKIEAGERLPSQQIAERLAEALTIEPDKRAAFVAFARSQPASGAAFHAPTNLPSPATPLIGRERDVADARKRLMRDDTRLLTLIGAPGIGKTRLALQVAAEVTEEFNEGAFFIPLAPIIDPDLVLSTIGQTLTPNEVSSRPWLDRLSNYLQFKQILLVLDNFEHVLPTAPLVAQLLTACPLLKILVTSRAALCVRAERQFIVPPLRLPDLTHLPTASRLADYAAVAMFVDRVQAVSPGFEITEENASAVAHICCRLDGLPLALELVAARAKLLSPVMLLERLSGQLMLHSAGLSDGDERHRTLMNAIAWSYNLFTSTEQRIFRKLGVFVGGWTLEAAEQVCADTKASGRSDRVSASPTLFDNDVLDTLTSLANKSLITQFNEVRTMRYSLFETVREYAVERLMAAGESNELRERHADYFLAFAEAAQNNLFGSQTILWLESLDREQPNLRAVLTWLHARRDTNGLMRLTSALARYWQLRGNYEEGRLWLDTALATEDGELLVRAKALFHAGSFAYFRGDLDHAKHLLARAIDLFQNLSNKPGMCEVLAMSAEVQIHVGEHIEARALAERGVHLGRELGQTRELAVALRSLSRIAMSQGNYDDAHLAMNEGLVLARKLNDPEELGWWLRHAGWLALAEGHYNEAEPLLKEFLMFSQGIGHKFRIGSGLSLMGELHRVQDHDANARKYFEEAIIVFRQGGSHAESAWPLTRLGDLDRRAGRLTDAKLKIKEGLRLSLEHGLYIGIANRLFAFALVTADEGRLEDAARWLGITSAALSESGQRFNVYERAEFDQAIASVRTSVGPQVFARAYAQGEAVTIRQAVEMALA